MVLFTNRIRTSSPTDLSDMIFEGMENLMIDVLKEGFLVCYSLMATHLFSPIEKKPALQLTWMAWSSTVWRTWRSMFSREGFWCDVAVWGAGGGPASFSVLTGCSLNVGGGAGGSWPMFLRENNVKINYIKNKQ